MNVLDSTILEKAFSLLDGRLRLSSQDPVHLVVCGGSALILTGLVKRTTRDVDVVALLTSTGSLVSAKRLPDGLIAEVRQIARDLDLDEKWLNSGPADIFTMGLPQGFAERLTTRSFGSHLQVSFISRLDQIHFKVYAAVDLPGRHSEDLLKLNPTEQEMEAAARWAMTHDVSEEYRMVLIDMLRVLGYESVAEKL
jgi:Nucleotidyltransferase of unknown function (DUF6036)